MSLLIVRDCKTRGKIEIEHIPTLERVGINERIWCDLVWNFKKYFGRIRGAGSPDRMQEEAAIQSVGFFHGQKEGPKMLRVKRILQPDV